MSISFIVVLQLNHYFEIYKLIIQFSIFVFVSISFIVVLQLNNYFEISKLIIQFSIFIF